MNPYRIPVTCSVCGEEGMMHAGYAGQNWLHEMRHSDPEVCADNLLRRRRELERREAKLSTQEESR